MKIIKKGKYYWHKDNSIKGLHPSYVYKKNDKKNRYNIVCFTSTKGSNRIKLNKNIDPQSNKECYVLKYPQCVKRSSFKKEIIGCKVKDVEDKARIRAISKKKQ